MSKSSGRIFFPLRWKKESLLLALSFERYRLHKGRLDFWASEYRTPFAQELIYSNEVNDEPRMAQSRSDGMCVSRKDSFQARRTKTKHTVFSCIAETRPGDECEKELLLATECETNKEPASILKGSSKWDARQREWRRARDLQ